MGNETLMTGQETTDAGTSTQAAGAEGKPAEGKPAEGAPAEGKPTEGKPAEGQGKPAEGDGKPTEGKPAEGAPETYEEFKAPEGVKLDEEVTGEFKTVAKELGLKQDDAQKVIDLGVKMQEKFQAKLSEHIEHTTTEWQKQARGDAEFGGDKLGENLAVAKQALDAFASDDLKTLLNESGLGNHPEIIRTFYRVGKAISEDKLVPGTPGKGKEKSAAEILYPNQAR